MIDSGFGEYGTSFGSSSYADVEKGGEYTYSNDFDIGNPFLRGFGSSG